MKSLFDIFYENAKRLPEKEAICCEGRTLTYREMADLSLRYANMLVSGGVKYRDNIGIPMNNSIESVALIMAASCIGAGLVPINPTTPSPAVAGLFEAGDVKHIIARSAFYKQMEKNGIKLPEGLHICLDTDGVEGAIAFSDIEKYPAEYPKTAEITGKETMFLTMTSGSTGTPKPIELTQENKYKRSMAHVKLYGIREDDRILSATPLYHSLAERLVILPLLIGATAIVLPRFTPALWLKCVSENRVTFTIAVSAQLSQIAQVISSPFTPDLSSLRSVVSSSALLEAHVRAALIEKLECDFHEMYGTSEVSTATSINFRESQNKVKSVGRAINEAEIKILRDDLSEAETGEVGEIAVKTELVFAGYYKKPEMTEKAMTNGFFKTGDLGRLDNDGYLYFAGRKKELIITGGINVYPNDIEENLIKLEGVSECAAFAYPDDRLGEVVALAVVPKEGSGLSVRSVQMYCVKNLADFQQPHHIFIVGSLPKNAMGKLVKSKIIEEIRKEETKKN